MWDHSQENGQSPLVAVVRLIIVRVGVRNDPQVQPGWLITWFVQGTTENPSHSLPVRQYFQERIDKESNYKTER